jgi:hypothetical protein
VLFAERDHEWLKRCDALEARVDLAACVERHASSAAKCENDAVERLANAIPPRRRP